MDLCVHYSYIRLYIVTKRGSECIENVFAIFPYLPKYLYTWKYKGASRLSSRQYVDQLWYSEVCHYQTHPLQS